MMILQYYKLRPFSQKQNLHFFNRANDPSSTPKLVSTNQSTQQTSISSIPFEYNQHQDLQLLPNPKPSSVRHPTPQGSRKSDMPSKYLCSNQGEFPSRKSHNQFPSCLEFRVSGPCKGMMTQVRTNVTDGEY